MAASESLYVCVDTWRHPSQIAGDSCLLPDGDTSSDWRPNFRFSGGVLRWAIEVDPETTAVMAIFASEHGLREGRLHTAKSKACPDFARVEMQHLNHVSGPLTDMFSFGHNGNSSLRVLERLARNPAGEYSDAKFMSVVRWRFRTDGDPLPDGTLLGAIPQEERFGRYQASMLPLIVPRLNRYSLIGGWLADTGAGTMASIGVYARESGMVENWADIEATGSEGATLYRHLELIDRIAGRVTDLMHSEGEEAFSTSESTSIN